MPKRRQNQPPRRSGKLWERSDVIQLLACLDYCLERNLDFMKNAVGLLQGATGKEYTERQISDRIWIEWNNYGRKYSKTKSDLLSEGSAHLVGYTSNDFQEIHEARGHLNSRRYTLQNTSPALSCRISRSRTASTPRHSSESSTLSIHATPEFEGLSLLNWSPGKDDQIEKQVGLSCSLDSLMDINLCMGITATKLHTLS